MNTQKVAITVPKNIIIMIDKISQSRGISRSKLITLMLEQKLADEKAVYLKNTYNAIFNDDSIRKEQRSTAQWFEKTGNEGGQEW
jgi:metal-responsive CopG/Arc/MetJ family transcriptional regulator